MSCIFCKIAQGEIPCNKVWEDEEFLAFLDINPIKEGHTLVIPKAHTDEIFDLPLDLYAGIFERAKLLAPALKKATHAKRIGIAVEGFAVPHVHVHLVPLMKGNELNPEHAKPAKPEELKAVQERIVRSL